MKYIDLTGRKFGRLTAITRVENKGRRIQYRWRCDCGNEIVAMSEHVKSGHTQSCGCIWIENCRKHGHGHDQNGQQTRTYKAWVNMRSRVSGRYEQYDDSYADRGITVCDRWQNSFENFLADMGECPAGKTLDRHPDNAGNYEPTNCRWATPAQQNRNMRRNKMVSFRGETMCLLDACHLAGMHPATIQYRLNAGWSVADALSTPPGPRNPHKIPLASLVLNFGSEWMMY